MASKKGLIRSDLLHFYAMRIDDGAGAADDGGCAGLISSATQTCTTCSHTDTCNLLISFMRNDNANNIDNHIK